MENGMLNILFCIAVVVGAVFIVWAIFFIGSGVIGMTIEYIQNLKSGKVHINKLWVSLLVIFAIWCIIVFGAAYQTLKERGEKFQINLSKFNVTKNHSIYT